MNNCFSGEEGGWREDNAKNVVAEDIWKHYRPEELGDFF
jgi:hypothetical protein